MENKLTLENIACYLPYGLKSHYTHDSVNLIRDVTLHNAMTFTDGSTKAVVVLRPMDLTKPIIVEGKEIIPIVELAKISYPNVIEGWYSMGKRAYSTDSIFGLNVIYNCFECYSGDSHHNVPNQLQLFQWLAKHKFDFMGLIEKGLAVSVDDLETNPYEQQP